MSAAAAANGAGGDAPGFIFRDEDFAADQETFDVAAFVARFRRVTPLESLREQLLAYSNHVRKQLYVIINRDYKDFITIATKLDGLDTRLMMIQRPLLDLRIDLSSLHNGITASLHTVQDKLHQRSEVVQRKNALQQILNCMDELSAAQAALQSSDGGPRCRPSNRHHLHRALDRLRTIDGGDTASTIIEEDVFTCSEFESAAASLLSVTDQLRDLSAALASSSSSSSAAAKGSSAPSSLPILSKALSEQLSQATVALREKISSHVEHYFTSASTTALAAELPPPTPSAILAENRGLAHCLRALVSIGQGKVAEELLAKQVVAPQLKALLSQGKVDGKEGKGSFSGFRDSLHSVLHFLSSHKLSHCLILAEALHAAPLSLDLVVRGVLEPVLAHLQERYPQMFSIGIAAIFSACYRAAQDFVVQVALLGRPGVAAARADPLVARVLGHPRVRSFFAAFGVDTYFQLRSREVMIRSDKVCELHVRTVLGNAPARILDQVYQAASAPGSAGEKEDCVSTSKSGMWLSLPTKELEAVLLQCRGLGSELFQAFAVEVLTILHGQVTLAPTYAKALGLVQRLVMRLALHVSLHLNITLPQLVGSRAEMEALRAACFDLSTYGPKDTSMPPPSATVTAPAPALPGSAVKPARSSPVPVPETPVKSAAAAARSTPAATPGTGVVAAAAAVNVNVTIEDCVRAAMDTLQFSKFLHGEPLVAFVRASSCLAGGGVDEVVAQTMWPLQPHWDGDDVLSGLLAATWRQVSGSVVGDCKRALSSVKAIAGKYRMTNKPAPTAPSPYVEAILAPLRSVVAEFRGSLGILALAATAAVADSRADAGDEALARWLGEVCEAITVAFAEQVAALFDTVKTMDNALQRRAKAPQAAPNDQLRDSDKIALQVQLDVQAFAEDLSRLGVTLAECDKLRRDVDDMARMQLQNK